MKRKTDGRDSLGGKDQPESKKRALSSEEAAARFRVGLFEPSVLKDYTEQYAQSAPYKHGVIHPLIEPSLLRAVRDEIQAQVQFTEKETDIYKIFQSGDLANLDGLDDASLAKLPSILKLRDAMYSARFREFLSKVTGSGKLSGQKTDMAINVYNEGCHLLCHDDVIGSRRLSYILYLTDPDQPWQAEWGGALRLYPTTTKKDANGDDVLIPSPDYSLSIPPAFNQLSFFTVQPGESFHDVEEVYHPKDNEDKSKKRVRMAISGWFHIPQEGEDGYEAGLEEKLAERSKSDLAFLIQYIAPSYLTPDIAEEMSETFSNESCLSLERFLSEKFATRVRTYIEEQESKSLPKSSDEILAQTGWTVARPPHKQRYLFQQHGTATQDQKSPIQELLDDLFPSRAFRKWLALITGADRITSYDYLARRFRRGQDYTLASGYDGEQPRAVANGDAEEPSVGGYEIYMAGDDEEEGDAAIYRSAGADDDDGILFSTAAGWNRLSIVLRDSGTLKFVKYVSEAAKGDRWDITGNLGFMDARLQAALYQVQRAWFKFDASRLQMRQPGKFRLSPGR
ncbi:hypothetical protein CAN33_0013120 [Aspergillus niger]|uniref:uS12 prolyl 3,4-dihydroxylase n=1 Tax=Aspergillus niger TaxID=5061 RepID=A0A505HTK7_ASPNG|nr:hypothetical protein CAN33_0013120 [Aspergillus niger]